MSVEGVEERHLAGIESAIESAPAKTRRKRLPCLLVLGALGMLLLAAACAASLAFLFAAGAGEAAKLGPWPDSTHLAKDVIPQDLSEIGLGTASLFDAKTQENPWDELSFSSGYIGEYKVGREPAAWIAALKYRTDEGAWADFSSIVGWGQENCGLHRQFSIGARGFLQCFFENENHKVYKDGVWIVHLIAGEAAPGPPDEFVNEMRDAVGSHWAQLD